jgi:hypothetical protein
MVFAAVGTGCAARTAPFDNLDDAQMTILKLQGEQQPASPLPGAGGGLIPGLPIPIPGLTPEQLMQQGQQTWQQMMPGVPFPFPTGVPGTNPAPAQPKYNGFTILQQGMADEDTKAELLDLFGDEESFGPNRQPCFTPGMAVIFTPPDGSPNVELMISFACNHAQGNGFQWPYANSGFTPESGNDLRNIYMRVFGSPPPPTGA